MSISLGELATRFGCDLNGDPDATVDRVATLGNAGSGDLSFFSNTLLRDQLETSQATAVILRPEDAESCPVAGLLTGEPYAVFARVASLLYPPPDLAPGVHPSAVIDPSASVAETAQIDAHVYVGPNSAVGDRVVLGPGCVVGPDCSIGTDSRLIARVTLARSVVIGERCILHPGAVIGSDGFGNVMTPEGWLKVPQTGGVTIANDVEIGANSTVDCGAIEDTVIEDGVRIDNLCHIAHNVRVGAHTAMASSVAIAGSVTIGKRCLFAGKVGTVGHIEICDDVMLSGRATVSKDITEPGAYSSAFAAEKARDWNRRVARFRRIDALIDRVKKLEEGER